MTTFVIARSSGSTKHLFTASSSYDRPLWVSINESIKPTEYLTVDEAVIARDKLIKHGSYGAVVIPMSEAEMVAQKVAATEPEAEFRPDSDSVEQEINDIVDDAVVDSDPEDGVTPATEVDGDVEDVEDVQVAEGDVSKDVAVDADSKTFTVDDGESVAAPSDVIADLKRLKKDLEKAAETQNTKRPFSTAAGHLFTVVSVIDSLLTYLADNTPESFKRAQLLVAGLFNGYAAMLPPSVHKYLLVEPAARTGTLKSYIAGIKNAGNLTESDTRTMKAEILRAKISRLKRTLAEMPSHTYSDSQSDALDDIRDELKQAMLELQALVDV